MAVQPGILPPNTDPTAVADDARTQQQEQIAQSVPGQVDTSTSPLAQPGAPPIPVVNKQRQGLSEALYNLGGKMIGSAMGELLHSEDVNKAVGEFTDSTTVLLRDRWNKDNATNFQNMVFKPYEQAVNNSVQQGNAYIAQVMADPTMSDGEKFAAARAAQYKMTIQGRNLTLQLQTAASQDIYKDNPLVKDTVTLLVNHQNDTRDDLTVGLKDQIGDQKTLSDIATNKAQQASAEAETTGKNLQNTVQKQYGSRIAESQIGSNEAQIEQSKAAAARSQAETKAIEEQGGPLKGKGKFFPAYVNTPEAAIHYIESNSEARDFLEKEEIPRLADQRKGQILDDGEQYGKILQQEYDKYLEKNSITDSAQARNDWLKKNKSLDAEHYNNYLAYLQENGISGSDGIVKLSDTPKLIETDKKRATILDSILRRVMSDNANKDRRQAITKLASNRAQADGKFDLADQIKNSSLKGAGYAVGEETDNNITPADVAQAKRGLEIANRLLQRSKDPKDAQDLKAKIATFQNIISKAPKE